MQHNSKPRTSCQQIFLRRGEFSRAFSGRSKLFKTQSSLDILGARRPTKHRETHLLGARRPTQAQSTLFKTLSLGRTSANQAHRGSVSWEHVGNPSTERLSPPRMTNPGVVRNRPPQPKDTWVQHNSPWISDTKASFLLVAFVSLGLHISASSQLDRLLCS